MNSTAQALRLEAWRQRLGSGFAEVQAVFEDHVMQAQQCLPAGDIEAWLDFCAGLGRLGRGPEPLLAGLDILPALIQQQGPALLPTVADTVAVLQKSPNGRAIAPYLQSLPGVARRLPDIQALQVYGQLIQRLVHATSVSIHGRHATEPSPSLIDFLQQAPRLVRQVPLAGLGRWMEVGIRLHGRHPQRQRAYFSLQSEDSRAVLQRERHGVLLMDVQARLTLGLRALWALEAQLVPMPIALQEGEAEGPQAAAPLQPYMAQDGDLLGLRLPEVLEDAAGVPALLSYRLMLAHMAMHRRASSPLVADNWSPLQRLAVECFEDARIDALVVRHAPGLQTTMRRLHPSPSLEGVDAQAQSALRVRLTRLSRALLWGDLEADTEQAGFITRFQAALAEGESSTREMAEMALAWAARTRQQSDQRAAVAFADTHVPWRDDNRHLWTFIEDGDEEDQPQRTRPQAPPQAGGLPPRHYPEWDPSSQHMRPDWVCVFDGLQPAGDATQIDRLLAEHSATSKHLQRLLDALKPQGRQRLRQQAQGTELDVDAALRAVVDARASGHTLDERVYSSHQRQGRNMAVLLLLDLSASVNDAVPGVEGQTVLSLTRAAVALLAQAIQTLGDQLAIAGFHSNTRHEVRYWHIKGFGEHWQADSAPKARLAAVQGAYSTRMGAALRHAGHLLSGRRADKRLLLVLTDGQPADVDSNDPMDLIDDAAHAVRELRDQASIYTHCVSVDAQADDYVQRIFGARYSVIDRVEQLPRRLPEIFVALTR
ncbi:nitric oxide reductase activation protein NorD [Ideonella paludis]|nr:VWA domain-containing protein [Ideonella paludis]